MTDRIEALRALKSKVEAGEEYVGRFAEKECGFQKWQAVCVQSATADASLNAAYALQKELLPEWTRDVDASAPECGIDVSLWPPKGGEIDRLTATNDCEARAWLLAILSALISQEGQSQ